METTTTPIPLEQLVAEVYDTAPPPVQDRMVSLLVGKIYEEAPTAERRNLIQYLMQPLGVLSLVTVANGIFAKIRLRDAWPEAQVLPGDVQNIRPHHVADLTTYAQQASLQVLDGLARIVTGSPVLATSAAAALLIHILVQRQQSRRQA